jgi:hypothetical protein
MNENNFATTRGKIVSNLKDVDALEAAGFQILQFHSVGERMQFVVVPIEEKADPVKTLAEIGRLIGPEGTARLTQNRMRLDPQQPKDYAEGSDEA